MFVIQLILLMIYPISGLFGIGFSIIGLSLEIKKQRKESLFFYNKALIARIICLISIIILAILAIL